MRLSQFNQLLNDEFGATYGQVLLKDLVLTDLSDRTGEIALGQGEDPKLVWFALCKATGVPKERWHGLTKKPTRPE